MRPSDAERHDVATAPSFRVRLFGVPFVEAGGIPVNVAVRPLCAVLLAMVALAEPERRLSRKALAAELWPDDDESTAATNLRRHLSALLAALSTAGDYIERDRDALWVRASAAPWCDVVAFERGDVDLYAGDFMEGFAHEWVVAQRERLRAIAVERFTRRAERFREDGNDGAAIADLRRAIEIEPADESLAQLEIELHGERGDVASVDAAYASLERRLSEIDLEPSPQTAALVERFHRLAREAAARLPRPLTSYVESEALAEVIALVPEHRLLTIVGPGGVGKTRLALEAAHRIAARFADGASFADLSTVSEGDALSDAISRALGAPTDLASKGFSGIKAFLRNRRALLLLDNCEQIGESCSWFLSDLLESATRVHVIATTRVTFGLRAERCYHLQPLSSSNALELFVDRARHAGSNVEAIARSTERIAAVCRRLDRLPLALELAAGMLGTVSLTDVERQLEAGLEKLRSRDQTLPARHRSLADVIAWSISLLDDHERSAFAKLAVFAGSFSAAAAAGICGVDLPTLGELVAKSVLVREDATEGRFVFLNSVGEYAHRLLDEEPAAAALRDAHAAWFADVAMRSKEPTFWHAEREWLQAIDTDFANAAQALDWSLFGAGAYANGIRLASGLTLYYLRCGFIVDGTFWVRAALERAEPGSLDWAYLSYCLVEFEKSRGQFEPALERAREVRRVFTERGSDREIALAWNCEGACLYRLRRMEEATAAYKRALAFAERSGDVRTEATILINLAFVDGLSDRAAARERFVLALRKAEQIGDESSIAYILASIATYDYGAGHFELAERNLERALATYRALEMIGMVAALVSDLGDVAVMRGEMARARERYAEALELCETHELESTYGSVLSGSAALALESGRPRDAAWLLGAAGLVEDVSKTGAGRRVPERVRQRVEQALGADQCALEVMYGRDLSHKEGTALARSVLASFGDDSKPRLEDRTQD